MKVVKVLWVDSCNSNMNWTVAEDIEVEPMYIDSFGVVVKDTDKFLAIAQNYGDNPEQYSNITTIPKGCIKEVFVIHEDNVCENEQKPYGQREECLDCQFNYAGECKGSCQMKRDEQKPADKVEPKFNIGDTIYNKVTKERCTITNRSLALQYYHDEDHLHEIRFSEQDDWEIIKPKFHEGEWITNGDYTWKIVEVKSLDYILQSQNGNIVDDTISHIDKQFHSFTIEDAKDGDVLIYNHQPFKWIFIFKRLYSPIIVSYYVMFTEKNKIYIDDSISTNFLSKITLATKEQRDLLFKKMKEADYEWDVEKKELKKIENEIEIPFGANDSELQEATYHIPKGFHAEIDGNKVVIKKGNQKPAWSKEDEEMLVSIISDFAAAHKSSIGQDKWLKSLKSRKLYIYNPYKAVVESIAKMCDKYENYMYDEKEAKDFLANVAVKCREAAEYDKKYMEE